MTTLKLDGRVTGAWVNECMQAWQTLVPCLGSDELWLDIRGVTFVDKNGVRLFAEIYRKNHVQFLTNTPLTEYFAEQAILSSRSENEA